MLRLSVLIFCLLALWADVGASAWSEQSTPTAERCGRICDKLVACGALAVESACLDECVEWQRRFPSAARQSYEAVRHSLTGPCIDFFRAALR